MASQAPKVDNVSKLMFLLSAVAILLVVYVLVSSLINTYKRNSLKGEVDNTQLVLNAENNIKSVGTVAAAGAVVANAAGRPPKEIYDAVCAACHATGVLDAPKFGDKAAWEARAGNGLAGLLKTATEGKGSMPAKGGDPSITDAELEAVIVYITKESGLDLGGAEKPAAEEAPKAAVEEKKEAAQVAAAPVTPKVTETPKTEEKKEVAQAEIVVKEAVKAVAAPVTAEVTKTPKIEVVTEAVTAEPAPKVEEKVAEKKAVAQAEVAVKEAAKVAAAPATPEVTETAKVEEVALAKADAPAAATVDTTVEGKKIYDSACFACHTAGIAGSPKLGDKAAWTPRIAQGMDTLYSTAINGKGAMPAKGGNILLEDSSVKAAVDYMVSEAK